ncbi:hypothetical protein Msil_3076 [Methylocella silvestris BL2]|uniref:Uncharacterized protein n=1 Tax=Methylocella silvestris (strain DSM 15510 / CIP 108128 / LMG 27833 / NCIMB 13906 / BL2) TaxID=395965 RepID=B8EKV7_METSB|nr:hypothetical protein [Methylocella silvestris]ACK51985.1 hypothetical protein Msil_3076 [Methylocella silvestris BL2]
MISPNTPAGTKVVCINTRDRFLARPRITTGTLDGLTEGCVYTVRCFHPDEDVIGGFVVYIDEILRGRDGVRRHECGYAPQRFRVLQTTQHRADTPERAPVRVRELEDA